MTPGEPPTQSARPAWRIRRSSAKKGDTSSATSQLQVRSSDGGAALRSSGRLNAKRLTSAPSRP